MLKTDVVYFLHMVGISYLCDEEMSALYLDWTAMMCQTGLYDVSNINAM